MRGDIWTIPAKDGSPRNLTRTNSVAERDGTWSPDGKWIAWLTDASGEYEIVLSTDAAGLDIMTARVEHPDPAIALRVAQEIRSRCEVRAEVEVLAAGTLPKTEFKARRVRDLRRA